MAACNSDLLTNRKWIAASNTDTTSSGVRFSILTYNILADKMIQAGQYVHWETGEQKYPKRHEKILAEVAEIDADVACFQEVEKALWDDWLLPSMRSYGYDGVHFVSPHDLGVAVLWKTELFTLEHSEGHVSTKLAEPIIQAAILDSARREEIRAFIERPSPVLLVKLRHRSGKLPLFIANIHTVWDDALYPQIQTLQISAALARLEELMGDTTDGAMVLLGDFNAPPDDVVYQFPDTGQWDEQTLKRFRQQVQCQCPRTDQRCSQISCSLPEILPQLFRHNFSLASAHKTLMGGEPDITSADCAPTYEKYCLDYIWYDQMALRATDVLELPSVDILTNTKMFPMTRHFPSDHLPIAVKFSLK